MHIVRRSATCDARKRGGAVRAMANATGTSPACIRFFRSFASDTPTADRHERLCRHRFRDCQPRAQQRVQRGRCRDAPGRSGRPHLPPHPPPARILRPYQHTGARPHLAGHAGGAALPRSVARHCTAHQGPDAGGPQQPVRRGMPARRIRGLRAPLSRLHVPLHLPRLAATLRPLAAASTSRSTITPLPTPRRAPTSPGSSSPTRSHDTRSRHKKKTPPFHKDRVSLTNTYYEKNYVAISFRNAVRRYKNPHLASYKILHII